MPDFSLEQALTGQTVAGLDEVGRGPLAGPVVAAAVIWPDYKAQHACFSQIRDSKKLSAKQRETLNNFIKTNSFWAIASASVMEIDSLNILQASLLAMARAVSALPTTPTHLLIDGTQRLKNIPLPQTCVIGGDDKSLSIAAAAIIAKVARDELMLQLAAEYPAYGWATNAGYGSAAHLKALQEWGPTPHHRLSFAPVRAAAQQAGTLAAEVA